MLIIIVILEWCGITPLDLTKNNKMRDFFHRN